jgi:hypothetical protein
MVIFVTAYPLGQFRMLHRSRRTVEGFQEAGSGLVRNLKPINQLASRMPAPPVAIHDGAPAAMNPYAIAAVVAAIAANGSCEST